MKRLEAPFFSLCLFSILRILNLFNLTVQITVSLSYRGAAAPLGEHFLTSSFCQTLCGIWSWQRQEGHSGTSQRVYACFIHFHFKDEEEVALFALLSSLTVLLRHPVLTKSRQNVTVRTCKYLWAFFWCVPQFCLGQIFSFLITKTN